ncbi:MAG: hypothetical protein ABUS57_07275 [Pseudomonadota bacterium]
MTRFLGAPLAAAPVALALMTGAAWAQTAQDQTTPATQSSDSGKKQESAAAPAPAAPCKEFCVHDLFGGVGLGVLQNLGGRRTDSLKTVSVNGGLFVQVEDSQDTNITTLFETHYLLKGQGIFGAKAGDILPALAACGPFALVAADRADSHRRGCGPFFAVSLESDAEVSQFGLGWFIGFGGDEAKAASDEHNPGFGVGVGLMVDPHAQTIDGRVVDTQTMMVRPAFEAAVQNGDVSLTTKESTLSLLVMISKDF